MTAIPASLPDPTMFSGLTPDELTILRHHLTSGWFKQDAVYPKLSDQWRETSGLLKDLDRARRAAFAAHMAHLADCPDHRTAFVYQRSEGSQEFWGCGAGGCKQGRWVS